MAPEEKRSRLTQEIEKLSSAKACGVTRSQFALVKTSLEVAARYGFCDEEAELVLYLSQDCGTTIQKAAEFYNDYLLQAQNGATDDRFSLYELCSLACRYDLTYDRVHSILNELDTYGYTTLKELPDGFFQIYLSDYNQNICPTDPVTICSVLEEMGIQGISLGQLSEVIDTAEWSGDDLLEVVSNYARYGTDFVNTDEDEDANQYIDPELAEYLASQSNPDDDDPFTIRR